MMNIPHLSKEVMLPQALEKYVACGATHMSNMRGNGTREVLSLSTRKARSADYSL